MSEALTSSLYRPGYQALVTLLKIVLENGGAQPSLPKKLPILLIVDRSAGETEKTPRIGPSPLWTDATSSDASSFSYTTTVILLANSHVTMTTSERRPLFNYKDGAMFLRGDGPAINHQPKNSFAIRGPARLARWAGWMSRRSLPSGGKG
jgi:hypothetical protein